MICLTKYFSFLINSGEVFDDSTTRPLQANIQDFLILIHAKRQSLLTLIVYPNFGCALGSVTPVNKHYKSESVVIKADFPTGERIYWDDKTAATIAYSPSNRINLWISAPSQRMSVGNRASGFGVKDIWLQTYKALPTKSFSLQSNEPHVLCKLWLCCWYESILSGDGGL